MKTNTDSSLVEDIFIKIAQDSEFNTINSITQTCHFFKNHVAINTIKENKRPKFAIGLIHTLILIDNALWVCGSNRFGQLGLGHHESQETFVKCPIHLNSLEKIIWIGAGLCHSVIYTNQGRLLVCGLNKNGQLGLDNDLNQNSFVECKADLNPEETIDFISAGSLCTALFTSQRRLLVCGCNESLQLGLGHRQDTRKFVESPLILERDEKVIDIRFGGDETLVFTNHKRLLGCGIYHGRHKILGNLPNEAFGECMQNVSSYDDFLKYKMRECSNYNLFTDEKAFVDCRLNLALNEKIVLRASGSKEHVFYTNFQRLVVTDWNKTMEYSLKLSPDEKIIKILADERHIILYTNHGRYLTKGHNEEGQLGLGHCTDTNTFTEFMVDQPIAKAAPIDDLEAFPEIEESAQHCSCSIQ